MRRAVETTATPTVPRVTAEARAASSRSLSAWTLAGFELTRLPLTLGAALMRKIILRRSRPLLHGEKFDGNFSLKLS